MAVFRVERTSDYTVMSNYHLRDKRLSLKAKGLLSQMLSLPEDWDYCQRKGGSALCHRYRSLPRCTSANRPNFGFAPTHASAVILPISSIPLRRRCDIRQT